MKVLREWFVEAPWGKIALISWGTSTGEPVLLVHGRQDSASTFIPLLEHCSPSYHYVGIDMPGNGRSDPFPIGIKITRFHFIAAVDVVIKDLGWQHFTYIGHSMGCEQGLFYNAINPNRIKKCIHLDLGPSLQRLQVHNMEDYYKMFYYEHYNNYNRDNFQYKTYTKEEVINAVCRARFMTKDQAALILERNLNKLENGRYKLSWDNRLKYPAPQNFPVEYYIELFSIKAPPTLLIAASDQTSKPYHLGKEDADTIIRNLQENLKYFKVVTVEGGHDVHFTNPERLAKYVVEFLNENFVLSKI